MKIHSIFESISGEAGAFAQGSWCTFIRLQGCNLQCDWCDTKQAQDPKGGQEISVEDVLSQCHTKQILITGGEPLLQKSVWGLMMNLLDCGHDVQIETNGSLFADTIIPTRLWEKVTFIVDYKCPSSRMHNKMPSPEAFVRKWNSFKSMIKFVVNGEDMKDIDYALSKIIALRKQGYNGKYIISPLNANGEIIPSIADRIKGADPVLLDDIIFSLQIHKVLNLP